MSDLSLLASSRLCSTFRNSYREFNSYRAGRAHKSRMLVPTYYPRGSHRHRQTSPMDLVRYAWRTHHILRLQWAFEHKFKHFYMIESHSGTVNLCQFARLDYRVFSRSSECSLHLVTWIPVGLTILPKSRGGFIQKWSMSAARPVWIALLVTIAKVTTKVGWLNK